jgi:predicted Rossmann-fold nucleotide-binding protein
MHDKPIVVLDPWGDLEPLALLVSGLVEAGFVRDSAAAQLVWTSNVDDAIAAIEKGWAEAGRSGQVEPTAAEWLEAEP